MAVPVGASPSFGVPKVLFQTQVPTRIDAFHTHSYCQPRRSAISCEHADRRFIAEAHHGRAELDRRAEEVRVIGGIMESMSPTTTLISVDEYLRLSCKPAFEYRDGVLTQKPMPTLKHSLIQGRIIQLLLNEHTDFLTGPELHVRLRESRYLVPDVAVLRKDRIQDPYPTEPIHLCVEILSPDDRFSEVVAKCEEYHAWGVPMVWIIDPVNLVAWEFGPNRPLHEVPADGSLTAPKIAIPLAEIFSVL